MKNKIKKASIVIKYTETKGEFSAHTEIFGEPSREALITIMEVIAGRLTKNRDSWIKNIMKMIYG